MRGGLRTRKYRAGAHLQCVVDFPTLHLVFETRTKLVTYKLYYCFKAALYVARSHLLDCEKKTEADYKLIVYLQSFMSVGLHLSIALPLVRFGLGFSVPFPTGMRGEWMTSLSRFVSMLGYTLYFSHSRIPFF